MHEGEVTRLLHAWVGGEDEALGKLLPFVIDDLRRLALFHLSSENIGHILQPTDLIHEAYLKLTKTTLSGFESRTHFFAFAARLMHEVLVEDARARRRIKRGRDFQHIPLGDAEEVICWRPGLDLDMILAVHEALVELKQHDPRQTRVAELRFFVGLTQPEVALAMDLSLATVERLWSVARLRMARTLSRRGEKHECLLEPS